MACASAIALADAGSRVLLVSTDPASNLDEVLGTSLSWAPTPVSDVPGLSALNIDSAQAAANYREKLVGPHRDKLPEAIIRSMEEQLSGACTTEIAAFDEFSQFLGDESATSKFDHVIFDTAPTGHTLRLLKLPEAWSGYLETNTTGNSCLGPLSGLQKQQDTYKRALSALSDAGRSTLVLVGRAQSSTLSEASRTSRELRKIGLKNQHLILNGIFQSTSDDPIAIALKQKEQNALDEHRNLLTSLPLTRVPLRSQNLVGVDRLRNLFNSGNQNESQSASRQSLDIPTSAREFGELVDCIAAGGNGVVMTMGKGGVGKTTLAAAIAVALAERGHRVHLSTTDPAHHLLGTVESAKNLEMSRIDPELETAAYVAEVMSTAGSGLDENGRELLEEDLRSPCTEEIAVFRAFARTVEKGSDSIVILDTAPTGHTLLLLDATESYHREVAKKASTVPPEVRELLPRLRDPEFTRVIIATLPEATPVHEAAMLQADLRRAQIEPFAWVINQSFAASGSEDPLLNERGINELEFINEVIEELSGRTVLIPWVSEALIGPTLHKQLLQVLKTL